jgi:hypothetical protein
MGGRKVSLPLVLALLLLLSTLSVALNLPLVEGSGTIYIRADGSVEGSDKIQRDGDVYTFADDISDSIVVEAANIVIDGGGHTLQGYGNGTGIGLTGVTNVTVRNMKINDFFNQR